MSSRAAKTYSARVKAKFVVVTVVFFASICLVFWLLVYLSSAFSFVSRMSPIRRKGRFVSRDVDKRKTFFRDNFAGVGRKTAVIKKGVRMIAAKSAVMKRQLVLSLKPKLLAKQLPWKKLETAAPKTALL